MFASDREDQWGLFWRSADGRGEVEQLATFEAVSIPSPASWSPDGETLLIGYASTRIGFDIGVLSLAGDRRWEPLLQTDVNEENAEVSPDGRWVAYNSSETGRNEVYVERFPTLGDREQISTAGGRQPVWSPDGRELFYRAADAMMVVSIDTEPTLALGTPDVVFQRRYFDDAVGRRYDLAPDGRRFLMIKEAGDEAAGSIQLHVVLNWHQELLEQVPVP